MFGDRDVQVHTGLVRAQGRGEGPDVIVLFGVGLVLGVVLVAHLTHEFLHEVLQGDQPGNVAELVHEQGHLQGTGAQHVHEVVEFHGVRDKAGLAHDVLDGHGLTLGVGHGQGPANVHLAQNVFLVVVQYGETGETGGFGLPQQIPHGVVRGEGDHLTARGHHVMRAAVTERERALNQFRGLGGQRALIGGVADQTGEFLGGAR